MSKKQNQKYAGSISDPLHILLEENMISFGKLIEVMDMNPVEPGQPIALSAIKAGTNIDPDFWDKFIQILGNADGLSELLDVPKEKITKWASRIGEMMAKVKQADDEESGDRKSEILPAGDIADPNGHPDHLDDMRPTP